MHAHGKSDDRVVPEKPPNKDGHDPSAEAVEGRRSTEGNTMQAAATRTQSRLDALIALDRVREAARRDRRARFTALLHHVTVDRLQEGFFALKHEAAPGSRRRDVGAVRHRPRRSAPRSPSPDPLTAPTGRSRRVASSSRRPTGDSVRWASRPWRTRCVQQAVVRVLNQIYEVDFLGFSYWLPTRPRRA